MNSRFLLVAMCLCWCTGFAAPVWADEEDTPLLVAAGQIGKPAPSGPLPTSVGTGRPFTAPMITPGQLFPALSGENELNALEEVLPPSATPSKPLNMGSIEYNENIAPVSNQPGVSAVQALNEALVKGPRAAAVRSQFAVSRAGFAAATQAPNPIFFFDRGIVAEQENRIGPVITSDAPWKLFFRLLLTKRVVAQTKLDLLTQLWSLRADVRRAYVEVVVAQETQKTLEQLYQLAATLTSVADKRFKAGDVPALDVIKARLATDQAEADVAVGAKRVLRAKQQLNILMGRSPDSALNVPALPQFAGAPNTAKLPASTSDIMPDFARTMPQLKEFMGMALSNRLELRSLAMQVQVNKANTMAAFGNVIPNATFAYGKSMAGNPVAGPKLIAVFFTLNAEVPISNLNQGAIFQAKATRNLLKYQILSQRNQVVADVSSAYNNLLGARKKIRVYQERLLADSEEVTRLARRSYQAGQSDLTSTLAAQQANVQVRNSYLDAVNSYASAFTDLEFAVGKPLQ